MKDTIFISHSTPEDNEFTIWLASRLQLLGFKVWIDKNSLIGGEKIWEEIDNVIRNNAIKFLLVYSNNICVDQQPGKLKNGISKELSLAESVANDPERNDFRILLKLDDSAFNLFIGANELNHITFNDNWAAGLIQLVKKLEKDNTPKFTENQNSAFVDWYENELLIKNGIVTKKELYYSNWWTINKLPNIFYIFQFKTEKQAKLIYDKANEFPISKISNCLSSFNEVINLEIEHEGSLIALKTTAKFEIKIEDVLSGFESKEFPTHLDSENHLKQLLKRVFHLLMKNRKMFWFELANKRIAYYYTPANLNTLKVKFKHPYRNKKFKTKNLLGEYQHTNFWHYAISEKPILFPIIAFSLKNHLTFSDDGFGSWNDKDKIHTHRRSKAKMSRYFNEDWRDFQCAFINGLCNSEGIIEIPLNKNFILQMNPFTEMFWASFGYFEPTDKERQGLMYDYYEEEEEIEEMEENDLEQ